VVKIDYRNGAGDGHVIWRLGQGGDFTVNSTDPDPWFSHQHDAHYIDDRTLILFDNGNTRRAGDPTAHSRGQVWTLDEQTMTATLVVNADLGSHSGALGAAERLSNGDYSFTLGTNGPVPPLRPPAHTVEVRPDGTKVYDLAANTPEYRTFRMRTLYEGVNDALAGAGGVNGAAAPGVLSAAASPTSNASATAGFSDLAPLFVAGPEDVRVLSGGTFDVAPTSAATPSLQIEASPVVDNVATVSVAANGGSARRRIGRGIYVTTSGVADGDVLTATDDVFATLAQR
jgi:hypothetical protein